MTYGSGLTTAASVGAAASLPYTGLSLLWIAMLAVALTGVGLAALRLTRHAGNRI